VWPAKRTNERRSDDATSLFSFWCVQFPPKSASQKLHDCLNHLELKRAATCFVP
jgi:hypothetical protein